MNELKQLESLGLVLPTPTYILGAILFGIIGWFAYRRGRKTSVSVLTWAGVALMLYPYRQCCRSEESCLHEQQGCSALQTIEHFRKLLFRCN